MASRRTWSVIIGMLLCAVMIQALDGAELSGNRHSAKMRMQNRKAFRSLSKEYARLASNDLPERFEGQKGRWKKRLDYLKNHLDDQKALNELTRELTFAALVSELPADKQNADVLPFVLPVFTIATEFHIPQRGDLLQKPLEVTACRGESEPASVHLLAVNDLRKVTLRVDNLSSGENVLNAKAVNLFLLKNWYQSGKGRHLGVTNQAHLIPELLLKDDGLITADHERQRNKLNFDPVYGPEFDNTLQSLAITQGTNRQFWLRVDVPKDQPAGKYCGEVVVENEGKEIVRIPLEVTVLPVTLEDSEVTFGAYSNYEYRPGAEKWKHARSGPYFRVNETFYRNLLQMCARYGMNSLMMQEGIILGDVPAGPAPPRTEYVRKAFELRREYGLTKKTLYNGFHWSSTVEAGVRIWNTPASVVSNGSHPDVKAFAAGLHELKRIYDDFKDDFPEFYVYTVDEPQNRPEVLVPLARAVNKMVQAAGLKTAEAAYLPKTPLGPLLDLMMDGQGHATVPRIGRHCRRPCLTYWHPNEDVLYVRKHTGCIIWYKGYYGSYPYTLANFGGHGWDDFYVAPGKGMRPMRLIYDGRDRPIPTIQMEAYREGVDDHKYLEMIERRCKKLSGRKLSAEEQTTLKYATVLVRVPPVWFREDRLESYHRLRKLSQTLLVQLESMVQKYNL